MEQMYYRSQYELKRHCTWHAMRVVSQIVQQTLVCVEVETNHFLCSLHHYAVPCQFSAHGGTMSARSNLPKPQQTQRFTENPTGGSDSTTRQASGASTNIGHNSTSSNVSGFSVLPSHSAQRNNVWFHNFIIKISKQCSLFDFILISSCIRRTQMSGWRLPVCSGQYN